MKYIFLILFLTTSNLIAYTCEWKMSQGTYKEIAKRLEMIGETYGKKSVEMAKVACYDWDYCKIYYPIFCEDWEREK